MTKAYIAAKVRRTLEDIAARQAHWELLALLTELGAPHRKEKA